MKFVVGEKENIRVIEIPEDARTPTAEDERILAEREAKRKAVTKAYEEKAAQLKGINEKKTRISELKRNLRVTDYQAIKFAEGEMNAEEYATVKEARRAWRSEINELESIIEEAKL